MKRIHYLIIGTLIVVVAILLARFLISEKKQPKRNATKKTEIFVKVQKVEYKENDISLNYRGRVESFNNIALSSEVSGKILKGDINLKAGTNFKKGDILFKIYSQDIEAQLIAQKSTFLQTLSNVLPDIKVDFPDQYSKWINFFNDFDINKKLPKLPQYSSNKEKVFLASQGLLTSYYNLAQKEITLGKYIVKAPFGGYWWLAKSCPLLSLLIVLNQHFIKSCTMRQNFDGTKMGQNRRKIKPRPLCSEYPYQNTLILNTKVQICPVINEPMSLFLSSITHFSIILYHGDSSRF